MIESVHPIVSRLRAEPGNRIRAISAATGIPYSTLRKWRDPSHMVDPRTSNLDRLRDHYEREAA